MSDPVPNMEERANRLKSVGRFLLFATLLYLFLVSIDLMGGSIKLFGRGFALDLIKATSNPVVGLFIGILVTSITQSSSSTTSILVGMVATGGLSIRTAIPIVMGANIGTSVTSTLVAMGHVARRKEFGRAFSAATLHDFFNLCAVTVLLPLECATHVIEHAASAMAGAITNVGGVTFTSPLKALINPASQLLSDGTLALTGEAKIAAGVVGLIVAMSLLFFSLTYMVKIMKRAIAGAMEKVTHGYLFKKPWRSMGLGMGFTALVQSSSVTTSLIVPLAAAGALTLTQIFPFLLGANIGTTITAILASMVSLSAPAVTIALSHLLFNIFGILIFYPLKKVPLFLATRMGALVQRNRLFAILFVIFVFFVIPLVLIFFTR